MSKTFFMGSVGAKHKKPEPAKFRQTGVVLFKHDPAKDSPTQIQRTKVGGKHIIAATRWDDTKSHEDEAADIFQAKEELIAGQTAKGDPFHPIINPEHGVTYDTTDIIDFKDDR